MKTFMKFLLILVLFIIAVTLIKMIANFISDNTWLKSVPNGDILFQSGNYSLNFIKADGSEHQELILKQPIIKPIWSFNGEKIIGLSTNPGNSLYYADYGYPAYWEIKEGKYKVCSKNQPLYSQIEEYKISKGHQIVLLNNIGQIVTFDLDTCKVVNFLVNYEGNLSKYNINGFSYQRSTQILLYGRIVNPNRAPNYQILKLDLVSGKEEVLVEGLNPSFSPDGSNIAYIGTEGIYLLESKYNQPRLLVKDDLTNVKIDDIPSLKPIIRWSPDGEWLVVHHCTYNMCYQKDAGIKIIRVSDGFHKTIFVGGKFPSWMP